MTIGIAPAGSVSLRGNRNHHTSIGVGQLRAGRSAAARSTEERPSQATVRSARISPVAPSVVR
ncbi:hypothetical protein FG87_36865 [Nocardia vulneris]|uniref:Uncharacterized protein n=1 Tax=Nocardia vulneris TaxID=1141657 RepID=A0ABR4Z5B4_9NOCA|nr:hypothetical protein FG87_36865 [Nocardia vulneris]